MSYAITGLPPGLTNESVFPDEVPGLFAWYDADSNGSIVEHDLKSYDRNDSVALDNLILYLPFDESNGSHAYDSSGNGHHGRLIDQATWTEGKSGGAISFDGSNDGMVFEKVAYMDRAESFTISFWFKRYTDISGNPTNNNIDNLMLAQSSSYDNENIEIGSQGSEIEIYLDSGSGQNGTFTSVGANITNNTWHHLTVTYGNGLKVYVDGNELLNQSPYDGPLSSSQDSPLSLGMGRIFSDQWGDYNGSIDDFRIYDVEINATQVLSLYNSGSGDFGHTTATSYDTGRIKYWTDRSANQRHGKYIRKSSTAILRPFNW